MNKQKTENIEWYDYFLRLVYPTFSTSKIATHLKCSEATIVRHYKRLKLTSGTKYRGNLLIGLVKNNLTVLDFAEKKYGTVYWKCQCKCGNIVERNTQSILKCNANGCESCNARIASEKYFKGCGNISACSWSQIRRGARIRNLSFNITIEEVWNLYEKQNGLCNLTKIPITINKSIKKRQTASLDRIDSKKGYEIDNLQWIHKTIQKMKNDINQDDFIKMCKIISESN